MSSATFAALPGTVFIRKTPEANESGIFPIRPHSNNRPWIQRLEVCMDSIADRGSGIIQT